MEEEYINIEETHSEFDEILKRLGVNPSPDNKYINKIKKHFNELNRGDRILIMNSLTRP